MANPTLTIRLFDKALHDRGAFSCGVAAMDRWLRASVSKQIELNRLRLWSATDADEKFVGFYALAAHSITVETAPSLSARGERHPIPAINLIALAIEHSSQNRGIGGALIGDALARAMGISQQIGAAAVILDVLQDAHHAKRTAFYAGLGFRDLAPDGFSSPSGMSRPRSPIPLDPGLNPVYTRRVAMWSRESPRSSRGWPLYASWATSGKGEAI